MRRDEERREQWRGVVERGRLRIQGRGRDQVTGPECAQACRARSRETEVDNPGRKNSELRDIERETQREVDRVKCWGREGKGRGRGKVKGRGKERGRGRGGGGGGGPEISSSSSGDSFSYRLSGEWAAYPSRLEARALCEHRGRAWPHKLSSAPTP